VLLRLHHQGWRFLLLSRVPVGDFGKSPETFTQGRNHWKLGEALPYLPVSFGFLWIFLGSPVSPLDLLYLPWISCVSLRYTVFPLDLLYLLVLSLDLPVSPLNLPGSPWISLDPLGSTCISLGSPWIFLYVPRICLYIPRISLYVP
jgi:hypothetical protein